MRHNLDDATIKRYNIDKEKVLPTNGQPLNAFRMTAQLGLGRSFLISAGRTQHIAERENCDCETRHR